mgnify:CR=1 FL=1|jgi:hypothetical protein
MSFYQSSFNIAAFLPPDNGVLVGEYKMIEKVFFSMVLFFIK